MDHKEIFEALADDVSAAILTSASEEERSADELAEIVDASSSTVYRRLETLVDRGLLTEGLQLDRHGNHYHVYRTTIKRIEVELENETVETNVERREDAVDRFVRVWEGIRGDS